MSGATVGVANVGVRLLPTRGRSPSEGRKPEDSQPGADG